MKDQFRNILKRILKQLAKLMIWRARPGIIGITGSVGKTSTKAAVAAVLGSDRHLRFAKKNFNNEIGLPLTILGEWPEIKGLFFWPKVILSATIQIIKSFLAFRRLYPELLILEYAVDKPGDMKYLLSIARPNISIITAIGEIPVHVEFFAGPEELAREKGRLIEFLPVSGFAILNYDDETVMALKDRTRGNVMTFGFGRGADVRITNFTVRSEGLKPLGINFKLEYGGSMVPVKINGVFGKAQGYAAATAACVGLVFGLNLIRISEALKNYQPVEGRMRLIEGQKETYILDDSYNASPLSMHAALDTLLELPGKRKIAVLGDMTEIGSYTLEAHEEIGRLAVGVADILVTVGRAAKSIAESALKNGFKKSNLYEFNDVDEAKKPVESLLKKGDLILVKGSHVMRMNEIVQEIQVLKEFDLQNLGEN
mgnify:CR=1 FL=1